MLPALAFLLACPAAEDDTGTPITCADPVMLTDANNYGFTGTLDIAETEVQAWDKATPVDYHVDWSGATADLQGHPIDPAVDIDMVTIVAFPLLTPAEIEDRLASNTLQQSDIGGYAFATVDGVTEIDVSGLTLLGNDIDIESYLTEGSATWMLLLSSGTTPGVGTRLLNFVIPTSTSTNLDVVVTPASTVLDYTVDLTSLTPVGAPADATTLDWSGITLDGRGDWLSQSDIDTVKLAYFADTAFADLAGDFLDVELNADALWTAEISSGSSLDLSTVTGPSAWAGFTDGTWAVALGCATCSNPAPLYFTQLQPCE